VVPLENKHGAPGGSDLLDLSACLRGSNEEKWFPRKKVPPPREPDLLTFLAAAPAEEE
jgi:hypothetical protein